MTVVTVEDITLLFLTGFGVSLLLTIPVVLCGYVFRLIHLFH